MTRYALRRMLAAPGFTAVAVLSLALGIGANTALFSLVNAALLRLIPVREPQQLYWVAVRDSAGHDRLSNYPFYESLHGDAHFAGLLCAFPVSVSASQRGAVPERVDAELVSGTYFATLGIRPHLGRLIAPEDDRTRPARAVVVVSHAWWQAHLGADPNAVGRTIELNGIAYTLIGVAPPGFAGIEHGHPRSMFVPMQRKASVTPGWDGLDKPLIAWLWIMVRLAPGTDAAAAGNELDARLQAFQAPHIAADTRLTPAQREIIRHRRVTLESLREAALGASARRHLGAVALISGALLALACLNLAGLMLARGLERRRELATRLAMGCSRARLMLQLWVESALLAAAGGIAGLIIGCWLAPWLARRFPLAGNESQLDVYADRSVLVFTLTVSVLTCLLSGVLPAWRSARTDLMEAIRGAGRDHNGSRLRHALLAGQTALALMLLVVAGLFAANFRRLLSHDTGFASRQLLIAETEPVLLGYDGEQRLDLYRRLDERLAVESRTPGSAISAAGLSNVAPMSAYYWTTLFLIDGRRGEQDFIPRAVEVGPGYFDTLRIPLRRGRFLDEGDDRRAPRAALISESLARRAFPGADPIGRRFTADERRPEESTFEIVGIAGDVDLSDPRRRDVRECVYYSYRQWPFPAQSIVIQARVAPGASTVAALETIRRAVRDQDPRLALYHVRTIETALDTILAGERMIALLGSFFAFVAALLAAIGLYASVARQVAAGTREIGVRAALGASRARLLWWIMRDRLLCSLGGAIAGMIGVLAGGHWLEPLLVDVRPTEPVILIGATVLLAAVSLCAALLPGRLVTRIEPAVALRWE